MKSTLMLSQEYVVSIKACQGLHARMYIMPTILGSVQDLLPDPKEEDVRNCILHHTDQR